MEFRKGTLLTPLELTRTATGFCCHCLERPKQKNPNWNKPALLSYKPALLRALRTGNKSGGKTPLPGELGAAGWRGRGKPQARSTTPRKDARPGSRTATREGREREGHGEQGAAADSWIALTFNSSMLEA